jgi:hypothetical protein
MVCIPGYSPYVYDRFTFIHLNLFSHEKNILLNEYQRALSPAVIGDGPVVLLPPLGPEQLTTLALALALAVAVLTTSLWGPTPVLPILRALITAFWVIMQAFPILQAVIIAF